MPAAPPPPDHDPLRAFLWGKRQSRRHALAADLSVRGALETVTAMSVDISANGVLLRVAVSSLEPDAAGEGDVDPFVLAETHFRGPCMAQFRKLRVKAGLEMVRLDYRPDDPRFLYLGFRFSRPLDPKQLRRFGLRDAHVGPEAHALPSEMVPLRAVDDPMICRLFNLGDRANPMFEGRVLGAGQRTLCVRLDDADLAMVGKRLRGATVGVEVLVGDQVDWQTSARLQAIGLLDDAGGALELGLVTNESLGETLRKKFQPPSAA